MTRPARLHVPSRNGPEVVSATTPPELDWRLGTPPLAGASALIGQQVGANGYEQGGPGLIDELRAVVEYDRQKEEPPVVPLQQPARGEHTRHPPP